MLHIAESLGDVIPSRRGGPTLDLLQLVDSRSARPSSLSARYGTGAFPFHTDCAYYTVPPRFVLLRMGEGCSTDRPTYLLDSQSLSLSPSQQEAARRVLFGVKGAGRPFLSPIFVSRPANKTAYVRYDPVCMRPLTKSAVEVASFVTHASELATPIPIYWSEETTAIIDNWRMFHARGSSELRLEQRLLQRVTVTAHV
jgi:alpha-ketoglutarate-dependent taurine dioxygenase